MYAQLSSSQAFIKAAIFTEYVILLRIPPCEISRAPGMMLNCGGFLKVVFATFRELLEGGSAGDDFAE